MMVACSAACSAEPKPPSGADSGMSLAEVGEALIGVWRSKAPPAGGSWTDEGCRLTEWIECDLVELSILEWGALGRILYANGPAWAGEPMFIGSWFRARCAVGWREEEVAEVVRRRPYGATVQLRMNDHLQSAVLVAEDWFPSNPTAAATQNIRCRLSNPDELNCRWAPNSELGEGVDPADRLVLERADPATEAPLCDELLERYLLSTRSPPPWHER